MILLLQSTTQRDTSVRFFCLKWFHQKYTTDPLHFGILYTLKVANKSDCSGPSMLWATTGNLIMRNNPLPQILLCSMGHCGKFGPALWATAAGLVLHNGPLRQVCSCTMGHCASLVLYNGPLRQVWSCTMGHCAKFGPAQWAIAASFVLHNGLLRGMKRYGTKSVMISTL